MLFVNLNSGIGAHQCALADELYKILGENYIFIEFGRKKSQFGSYSGAYNVDYYKDRPYILKMYESEDNEKLAKEFIQKADVIRTGGEPIELTKDRILRGKLTFRSTERALKGPWWKDIWRIYKINKLYSKYSNSYYRVLCQSAYMPNDLRFCGNKYSEKCYKFAYFTQIPKVNIDNIFQTKEKDKIQIVWCARFIDWKHPELPLKLARKLIERKKNNFIIKMIGANNTTLWKEIKREIDIYHLNEYIELTGGLPNFEVLEVMRKSHIFIFTSDKGEGWGAVLNEAMGSGCACVASNEIGAVPFLIKHKENGLIFKSCSVSSLFENVSYLYDHYELCFNLGRKAYDTITNEWSAKTAAQRLVQLSESILAGKEIEFQDGPCAKAYPVNADTLMF